MQYQISYNYEDLNRSLSPIEMVGHFARRDQLPQEVRLRERAILDHIADCAGRTGIHPSIKNLAKYLHCDERTIRRGISKLKELGVLTSRRTPGGNNSYTILLGKHVNPEDQIIYNAEPPSPSPATEYGADNRDYRVNKCTPCLTPDPEYASEEGTGFSSPLPTKVSAPTGHFCNLHLNSIYKKEKRVRRSKKAPPTPSPFSYIPDDWKADDERLSLASDVSKKCGLSVDDLCRKFVALSLSKGWRSRNWQQSFVDFLIKERPTVPFGASSNPLSVQPRSTVKLYKAPEEPSEAVNDSIKRATGCGSLKELLAKRRASGEKPMDLSRPAGAYVQIVDKHEEKDATDDENKPKAVQGLYGGLRRTLQ